jgi:intracellular multiplication protein IcmE
MTDNYENHEQEQHEHDEFVEPEIGISSQAASKNVVGNIAEAWRTRPLVKFIVLIIAVSAVAFAGMNLLGSGPPPEIAHMATPPHLREAPGGETSPAFRDQTKMANDERSQFAAATGGSAMPTPIRESSNVGGFDEETKKPDPLNELRVETEKLQRQVAQQQIAQQQGQQQQQPFDNSLADAMQKQMRQLLESWEPKEMKVVKGAEVAEDKTGDKSGANNDAMQANKATLGKALVSAGTVSYAQLLTEANSDVPGPILAQIVSGPLSGARAIGAFQVSDGYERYLVLKFTLADKKGKDYKIDAIALDPDTTLGGMATEVDERYFARVVLPAAAAFLQGLGQALGQGNSATQTNGAISLTTTTGNGFRQGMYNGLGSAAQTAGQFFQNQANLTKPLVRVAAGTPMGLFFIEPVYDPDAVEAVNEQKLEANAKNNGAGGNGLGASYNNNAGLPYPNQGGNNNGFGGSQNNNSGVPYPNYGNPGGGYGNLGGGYGNTRMPMGYGAGAGITPTTGFGQ